MMRVPSLPRKRKFNAIGVFCSGGDAPGMNAAVRSVVRYGLSEGVEVFGIQRGYSGLLEGRFESLTPSSVANIIQRGGTVLKTSRCPAFHKKTTRREAADLLRRNGIEALIAIGGDGTFRGAHLLEAETGIPVVGVPGTIDNDIPGSELTIGYDTAVNTAMEAIDRIRDTASSHDRIFIVEVMGRNSGFIALEVGLAGGAETIVIPEVKTSIHQVCESIEKGIRRGKLSSIIVAAEGPKRNTATVLSKGLKSRGYTPRVCILGHIQRGGTPTALDRNLASILGASAVRYLLSGKSSAMVGIRDGIVTFVPFSRITGHVKKPPKDLLDLVRALAG